MTAWIVAHVWQSTLCAVVAALVALALRSNHARIRHRVWVMASLKFLVPFSLLNDVGRRFAWQSPGQVPDQLARLTGAARPLVIPELHGAQDVVPPAALSATAFDLPQFAVAVWIAGAILLPFVWLLRWRALRRSLRAATPVTEGREVEILGRVSRASGLREIPILSLPRSVVPSVLGCFRPVILWPAGIGDRMNDEQIAGIFLHELAHVRRRDNLVALVHLVVQSMFWFHPVTWWIGARLEAERERACDEEVLRLGIDRHQYAESILIACEYSAGRPPVCVSGVTGSALTRRVADIVSRLPGRPLGGLKRAVVAILALLFGVGPVAAGAIRGALESDVHPRESPNLVRETGQKTESTSMNLTRTRTGLLAAGFITALATPDAQAPPPGTMTAPVTQGLQFEVASIKHTKPDGSGMVMLKVGAAGNTFTHMGPIRLLIQQAHQIPAIRLLGGPDWLRTDIYNISARIPDGVERTPANTQAMARALLADRFKLVVHEEERDQPIYELVYARADKRLGPGLVPFTADCLATPTADDCRPTMTLGRGTLQMKNAAVTGIVSQLESIVGRPVVDRTGLAGRYNIGPVSYASDQAIAAGTTDLPSIFTVIQEQLGLKLESQRGPVKVVVIDSIQRPTED